MREEIAELAARRPRLRGVSHQWAAVVAAIAGAILIWRAPDGKSTAVAAVYAASLVGLFAVSATYHRITWRPAVRRWLRRLDHAMIFVFIAGTVTPVALLVVGGTLGIVLLCVIWAGALGGVVLNLAWVDAPKVVSAIVYIAVGWIGVAVLPELIHVVGAAPTVLFLVGGALYSIGAVVYARGRPNPVPSVFGYHEVFHALVIAAAVAHFVAVAGFIVPRG